MFYGHAALLLLALLIPLAAAESVNSPGTNSPGAALFLSECAFCHGTNAGGGRGPNLLGRLVHTDRPEALLKVIKNGVPGTAMPGFDLDPEEMTALLDYLKTLRQGKASPASVPGSAEAGRAVYARQACAGCHRVNREGSTFGPDLSRVGGARSYEYLRESIVNPSTDVPEEFRAVRITTVEGSIVNGVRANEDTFSVQIRLPDQSYRSFIKAQVKSVEYPAESLMPPYKLSEPDLVNLLAYLYTLRGDPEDQVIFPSADSTKSQGVH